MIESIKERYFEDEKHLKREAGAYGHWMLREYGATTTDKSEIAEICYNLRISNCFNKLESYLKNKTVRK